MPSKWSPKSFQEVVARVVNRTSTHGIDSLVLVLENSGPKHCPSPSWDLEGSYRVALVGNTSEIQKLTAGDHWVRAELHAPVRGDVQRTSAGVETRSRNILFMDVSGWSKLTADQIHAYATGALPEIGKLISGQDFLNTWGDAIVATFDSAKNAAEGALKIRDFFVRALPNQGIPQGLTCRIGLHQGEVIVCRNALTGTDDIFGEAVHIAARLEPATVPGYVFCTDAFARALSSLTGLAPRAWPIGPLELPKGFGQIQASVVTWNNEPDPTVALNRGTGPVETAATTDAPSVEMSDGDARISLRGWLNKLPVARSGETITFEEIDAACGIPSGATKRLLPDIVAKHGDSLSVEDVADSAILLNFDHSATYVVSDHRRGGY